MKELKKPKDTVKEWFKAGDDFASGKIDEDKYDKAFDKLKDLIKET